MLALSDVSFTAWGRPFLQGASVTVPAGAKAGLVGRNGAGKSTLFRLVLGEFSAQGGHIALPKGRVVAVEQEHAATPQPLVEAVLAADTVRADLLAELEHAPPERLGELHARLIDIGADAAPARAAEILTGLGFRNADLPRPIADFSGGWRMRAALAGALLAEPNLLLLDEPTNYLDLEGALWLEARLKRYPRTAVIISHDRELLNGSCDMIVHLTEGRLDAYPGGYDQFERQRAERARLQAAQRVKQEAERAHLQSFVDRFRAKASKAAQAQSRIKRLAKLEPVATTLEERVAPFRIPSPERPLNPPLVRLENAAVGYDGQPILSRMSLRLDTDDRIGLLGVNGAGKSTFAKLLAGALEPLSGRVERDRRLRVAWFHQHQIEALDPAETPLDIIRRRLPELGEAERRSRLSQFGLSTAKQETTAQDLSGGERARLLLNMVAMDRPHVLLLDEPTNHLDIDSRRALLDALTDYEGAVVLITHDRSLMELVADRLWLAADGRVEPYDGDMDAYARLVLDRARLAARTGPADGAENAGPSQRDQRKAAADARARVAPLKKAADAVERRMDAISAKLTELDAALADPALFTRDAARAVALGKARAEASDALAAAELQWMEAAEAYETARAEAG